MINILEFLYMCMLNIFNHFSLWLGF